MIQPLMSAQRIVPHFTPSKCQRPKARKLIAMPKQKNEPFPFDKETEKALF